MMSVSRLSPCAPLESFVSFDSFDCLKREKFLWVNDESSLTDLIMGLAPSYRSSMIVGLLGKLVSLWSCKRFYFVYT